MVTDSKKLFKAILVYWLILLSSGQVLTSCDMLGVKSRIETGLKSRNPEERTEAIAELALYAANGFEWAVDLANVKLAIGEREDRIQLIWDLGFQGTNHKSIFERDLVSFLDSDDRDLRAASAWALGCINIVDEDTIDRLLGVLNNDENETVRYCAFEALQKISSDEYMILTLLEAIKKEAEGWWPGTNLETWDYVFASYGDKLKPYIKDLCDLLNDPEAPYITSILDIIAILGPIAQEALPCVQALTASEIGYVRDWSQIAVKRIMGIE